MPDLSSLEGAAPSVLGGRYEIVSEVGHGGFALIYRAIDRTTSREVAVKVLRSEGLPRAALERFRREMDIASKLEHPNILRAIDAGVHDGVPFMVMDLVDGPTLEQRLAREGALNVDDALKITRELGAALTYAHGRGVVHRDVKPANILLARDGARLADFGIARLIADTAGDRITSTGLAVGTMSYMSPEQLCAEPSIDARADQYSLALVLYEMLTGVLAHTASSTDALRALRLAGTYVPVRKHRPAVTEAVDAAIARALRPAAADRFRDTDEFVTALGTRAFVPRRQVATIASVAVLLVVLVAGAWRFKNSSATKTVAEPPDIAALEATNVEAAVVYRRGWEALMRGKLDSARSSFAATAASAPSFSPAQFWEAQTWFWLEPKSPAVWRDAAIRAARSRGGDSLNSDALIALAKGDAPRACQLYERALNSNPNSFVAAFGLGECGRLDSAVIADTRVPGGLRFRSSHWSTVRAYSRAIDMMPSQGMSVLFDRVLPLTFATGSQTRQGIGPEPDRKRYVAFPSLAGDSIVSLPVPREDFVRVAPGAMPATYSQGVSRGKDVFLEFTRRWIARAPGSEYAWLARATALELSGSLDAPEAANSAATALARADTLSTGEEVQARIAVARVRVAFRRDSFALALSLARAALARTPATSARTARLQAPLAAFLGNANTTARLLRIAASSEAERTRLPLWASSRVSPSLADSLRSFGVRAAIGECAGLDSRRRAIEAGFSGELAASDLARERQILLAELYRLASPCLGASLMLTLQPEIPFDHAARALARGDTSTARRTLAALSAKRAGMNRSALTQDALLIESWLLLQLGDSAGANARLRANAENLSLINPFTFDELTQAAAAARLAQTHRSP